MTKRKHRREGCEKRDKERNGRMAGEAKATEEGIERLDKEKEKEIS